ncbi:MAG: RNA polymerase factor sigma-54 [Ahniella sp.]|nr:RNA polymerase factor sigma-54 [Ahniella sp.]
MKQSLNIGLNQSLKLTPQLTQSIRLLAMSTIELEAELSSLLDANPLLERESDQQVEEDLPLGQDEPAEVGDVEVEIIDDSLDLEGFDESADWAETSAGSNQGDEDEGLERNGQQSSLVDDLRAQVALLPLTPRQQALAAVLIDALDADGYLRAPIEDLLAALPDSWHAQPAELDVVRQYILHLDPPGVCARTLGECLAAQLEQGDAPAALRALALKLVREYLEQLPRLDTLKVAYRLGCKEADLKAAIQLIRSLNPKPGNSEDRLASEYIVPDLIARKINGRWRVTLTQSTIPALCINRHYERMAAESRGDTGTYLRGQLQEARWLMKSLQQRGDTLIRVGECILREQGAFLDYGPEALRPLTLKQIAEEVGLHESTISRATLRKYMATPRGVFELKRFFSSGVNTDGGGEASATAVQAMIRKLIEAEDRSKPLSDQVLAELLKKDGVQVARRTVAKYREAINIPSSSERCRL